IYRTGHANFSTRADERRALVIEQILPEFLSDLQIRKRIGERTIREAYSALYLNRALYARQVRYWSACVDCMRGIRAAPWRLRTWSEALRCLAPVYLKRAVKGACGLVSESSTR